MDYSHELANISIRSLRAMLCELANLCQKGVAKLPTISVCLHSGQTFAGRVVRVEQGHQYDILMLHQVYQIDRWQAKNNMIYLNMNEIVGLTLEDIDNSDELMHIISGGKTIRLAALEPVSKLNFQRFLRDKSMSLALGICEEFVIEIEGGILESKTDFADYQFYIDKTILILESLLKDALGREALQSKVKKLKITNADAFAVKLSGQDLTLFLNTNEVAGQLISNEDLKNAIEQVL
jgi:hypothetical protein